MLAARPGFHVALSLAGRTGSPVAQGVPTRSGGFGGARGLARHLRDDGTALLVDATHPYAARISANASEAALLAGVPSLALRRPGWEPVAGDRWTLADDVAGAARALGEAPRRVFLALGRQEVGAFEAAPRHRYLVRSVDPVDPPLTVPDAQYILSIGPFDEADERALLTDKNIDVVVTKNSGGEATYAKIAAARALGIEVVMVERRHSADVPAVATAEEALDRIAHLLSPAIKRGV